MKEEDKKDERESSRLAVEKIQHEITSYLIKTEELKKTLSITDSHLEKLTKTVDTFRARYFNSIFDIYCLF